MAEDKQLTVAELLARARKNNPDAGTPKRRRRRSLEDGGISVAELTGSFPAVTDAPPQAKHTAVSIDGEEKPSSPAKDPQPEPEKPAPKPAETAKPAAKKPAEKPSAAKPAETKKPAAKTPAPTAPATKPAEQKKPEPTAPAGKKPAEAAKPVEPKKPAPKTPADKKPAPATKPAETKKPEPKTPAAKTPAEQKETAAKKPAAKPSATKPAEPKKPAPKTPATAPAESKKPAEPKKPAEAVKPAEPKKPEPTAPAAKKPAPATPPTPAAADADDAKTGVLKKVDVQEPKTAAETKRSPVEAPVASSTPGVEDTGVMPAVADSAAGGNVGLAERTDTDLEDQAEEESGGNAVAVIGMAVVGIVIGAVVFFVFEMLWGSLNPWLTGALALAVTAVMIFAVRALRTTRDGMTMTLAGLVGLVTTFGPALISL